MHILHGVSTFDLLTLDKRLYLLALPHTILDNNVMLLLCTSLCLQCCSLQAGQQLSAIRTIFDMEELSQLSHLRVSMLCNRSTEATGNVSLFFPNHCLTALYSKHNVAVVVVLEFGINEGDILLSQIPHNRNLFIKLFFF